jgi:hypothetical protein
MLTATSTPPARFTRTLISIPTGIDHNAACGRNPNSGFQIPEVVVEACAFLKFEISNLKFQILDVSRIFAQCKEIRLR